MDRNKQGVALKCDAEEITYSELEAKIEQIANELRVCGIGRGCKVVVFNDNPIFFSLIFCTLLYMGAVPIPLYAKMTEGKVREILEKYEINFVVAQHDLNERILGNYEEYVLHTIKSVVCNLSNNVDREMDDVELIMFTSGTTSIPKAIMLTRQNIQSNVEAISDYLQLSTQERILHIKDLSHSSSVIGELLVGLYNGCTIVFTTQMLLSHNIIKLISQEQITVFFAVPTLLNNLLAYKKMQKEDLDSVRIVNFYGAAMHEENIKNICDMFRKANVIYSYGQTEASPRVTYIEKKDLLIKKKSSGRAIKGVTVFIEDEEKNVLPANTRGEIVVVGPNVMKGYYKDQVKTKQAVVNGRLYTKDIGYLDEEGFLYVTGRKDNMLITAGKNVYPEEIEGVLTTHSSVVEAMVLGKLQSNGTLLLEAYVVVKNKDECDLKDLFLHCIEAFKAMANKRSV